MSEKWLEFRVETDCEHSTDIYGPECPLCIIAGLTAENERLRRLLKQAELAIDSLEEEALGYGQGADMANGDVYHWSLKDELLTNIREALKGGE